MKQEVLYNIVMCFHRKVFAHATNIFEIDVDFFLSNGVKTLFIDLDNTLDSYRLYNPTQRAVDYIDKIQKAGIKPIIISNNKGKRVSSYANSLGIEYLCSAHKPFAKRIKRFMAEKNIDNLTTMMVGDQLVTDAGMANKANIKMVLTDKIVKEDQWTTHFNRLIDRPLRKHYAKKGKLIDWRTRYGQS